MREILFRGKRVDNGEWVEGSLIVTDYGYGTMHYFIQYKVVGFQYFKSEVIPESVGQFIEALDKNGNKIFEGDILLTDTIPQFVKFNQSLACWGVAQNNDSATISIDKSWIIIGNIHDK